MADREHPVSFNMKEIRVITWAMDLLSNEPGLSEHTLNDSISACEKLTIAHKELLVQAMDDLAKIMGPTDLQLQHNREAGGCEATVYCDSCVNPQCPWTP